MQEMKFDGSLQAAGYSILHKTVEILGRMTKKHDITINMLREQLESSTMEAESESRTAELNRQNDWKECHVIDICRYRLFILLFKKEPLKYLFHSCDFVIGVCRLFCLIVQNFIIGPLHKKLSHKYWIFFLGSD